MRFISRSLHAWLDYPVALGLITLPFLLGLGSQQPIALAISPIVGLAAFVLTVFTDHELGVFRVLPYRFHQAADLTVGLLFLAVPFAFGLTGLDAAYYWINGATVVVVIGLSAPETLPARDTASL